MLGLVSRLRDSASSTSHLVTQFCWVILGKCAAQARRATVELLLCKLVLRGGTKKSDEERAVNEGSIVATVAQRTVAH